MARKTNIMKRICAGVLTALMVVTSVPVDTLAGEITDFEQEESVTFENDEVAGSFEEDFEESLEEDFEESLEEDKYSVTIDVSNVDAFVYALVDDIGTGAALSLKTVNVEGLSKYEISDVPNKKYIAITSITPTTECDNPRLQGYDDGNAWKDIDKVDVGTYQNEQKLGWPIGPVTEEIQSGSYRIIADTKVYEVTVNTQNITQLSYATYTSADTKLHIESSGDDVELTAGTATISVPTGQSLAIDVLYDEESYNAPKVTVDGSEIAYKDNIGITDEGNTLSGYDLGQVTNDLTVSAVSEAKKYFDVIMYINNITSIECMVFTLDSENIVTSSYKENVTISGSTAKISVPEKSYVAITDITCVYPDTDLTVENGSGEVDFEENYGIEGYHLGQIIEDASDIEINNEDPADLETVSIQTENIAKVTFAVFSDKSKITADCLKEVTVDNEGVATIAVPVGSFVAIRKIVPVSGKDLKAPVVMNNGVAMDELEIGTFINNGVSTKLKGYTLGKVTDDESAARISSSYQIECKEKSYNVNISAQNAKTVKYKISESADFTGKEEKSLDVTLGGVQISVPTGNYLAISEIVPNDGIYGDEVVTYNSKKLTKGDFGFVIGPVNSDITSGITAKIDEKSYDVVINVEGDVEAEEISYVVSGALNSVATTTQTVAVDEDTHTATIKVTKGQYLVLTEFKLPEGHTVKSDVKMDVDGVSVEYGTVGKYSSGTILMGWNLGTINAAMPHEEVTSTGRKVVNKITAKCSEYCMSITPDFTDNISVTYKEGTTKKTASGQTTYYVIVAPDDTSIKAEDLIVYVKDNDGTAYTQTVYAYPYLNDNVKGTPVPLTPDTDVSGIYTLSADDILDWSTYSAEYTTIVLEIKSERTITFPEDGVDVYTYDPRKMTYDSYSDDPLPEDTAYYNGKYQFVVKPEDLTNFEVDKVEKKYAGNRAVVTGPFDVPGSDEVKYYEVSGIVSDVELVASVKTKNTSNVIYTVDDETAGEVKFASKNSTSVLGTNAYKVNTGVSEVNFTITIDKSCKPMVRLDGVDEFLTETGKKDVGSGKDEYTYVVPAKDIKVNTVIIAKEDNLKDIYIQCKDNEVDLIVTLNGAPRNEEIGEEYPMENPYNEGFTIHQYKLPYSKVVQVQALARENCQLTNATINSKTVKYGDKGMLSYTVGDNNNKYGNDFVINSQTLTTLYFSPEYEEGCPGASGWVPDNLEPVAKNSYSASVSRNAKGYRAVIMDGTHAVEMSETGMKYVAKIGTKDVTNDVVSVGNYKYLPDGEEVPIDANALLVFDFENKDFAGKTITVTVSKNGKTLSTLKFAVSAMPTTVSFGGSKNATFTQEFLSEKSYKIAYNSGVKFEDVALEAEFYDINDNIWKGFSYATYTYREEKDVWEWVRGIMPGVTDDAVKSAYGNFMIFDPAAKTLKVRADKETLGVIAKEAGYKYGGTTGLPKIRFNFYDRTDKDFGEAIQYGGLFASKEMTFTMNNLRKITPSAKLVSASDTELYVGITAPSNYSKYLDTLYYKVTAEAVGGADFPATKLTRKVSVTVPMTQSAARVPVALEGILPGKGAAWKYNVTVTIFALDAETPTDPYGYLTTDEIKNIYDYSKDKVLKNLSTKNPYYETKISASAKNNKLYQGQENVWIATAKFNSKTTFYGLNLELYKKGETPLDDGAEPVATSEDGQLMQEADPTKIMLDATGVLPGDYVLYITPESATAYALSATVPVTVYESIGGKMFDEDMGEIRAANWGITLPSTQMYRKDNSSASMTVSTWFENKPKSTKVTWEIVRDSESTRDITDCVKISSAGKITIDKKFEYDKDNSHNNVFWVKAKAADYTGNTSKVSSDKITIVRSGACEITQLKINKGGSKATCVSGKPNTYFSNALDKVVPVGANPEDCTFKSSNAKAVSVSNVAGHKGELTINGTGKVKLTVTCNDGGKSSKSVSIEIVNARFEGGLGIEYAPYEDAQNYKKALPGKDCDENENPGSMRLLINVGANDETELVELTCLTNYSLSVKSGGKLYSYDKPNNCYLLEVSAAKKTVLVLKDNTRKKGDSLYEQTFEISNTFVSDVLEKGKASYTNSSVKPNTSTLLKITGLKDKTAEYTVYLAESWDEDLKDTTSKYDNFKDSETGPIDNENGVYDIFTPNDVSLAYSETYKAFVPVDGDELTMDMRYGSVYGSAVGKYNFNAYVSDEDGKLVSIIKVPTLALAAGAKPSFSIIGSYSIAPGAGKSVKIEPDKCSNLTDWSVIEILDANSNGLIDDPKFSDYYQLEELSIVAKDGAPRTLERTEKVYADVTCRYVDLVGKTYYVTKRIYVMANDYYN